MKKHLALLLVLILSFFAYNTYTYHQLSSAEGAYKLVGVPSDEKLIAVYHDENSWQFATYNPKTKTLKVYYITQNSLLSFRTKKTKSVKTSLNYSPLALDLKLLEKVPEETPSLLFAGKWYTEQNPPNFPTANQVVKEYNKTIRRMALLYAKRELWIKTYLQVDTRAYEVGTEDVLVIPNFGNTPAGVWVVEIPQGHGNSTKIVYYPDFKITGETSPVYMGSFVLTEKPIETAFYTALMNLSKTTSFAKIEVYCLSPKADIDTVAIKRYYPGISMKEYFPFHYLHKNTIEVLWGCKITTDSEEDLK
ncbi:hypothetical protein E3E35_07020 [Thermococcus sp. GR7]|uniref:hypothetical protein n=1 Tax=unclassified Thermococcus TaxID=2627626 RepID=UPI00143070E6|nr:MULTISPECIES: hypothetical protein [unclassified Thermococcus]NJE47157.1 hypothetical protein [Thermococcus sp. GR7]NJE78018.1 hypothetical protein [Thermococcus sp. GR4]NJF22865.1 hypothetical protein [Thermococcus sp. GR5]